MADRKAILILEDGACFEGTPFGKPGKAIGETVFYTGVVGYQEVLTSPAYAGTLAAFTYPIIGSYGINDEDRETPQVHPRGIVIREYSLTHSNFRATESLEDFLTQHSIVGIRGVDTRALAIHLRDHGEMKGMIISDVDDPGKNDALSELKQTASPWQGDLLAGLRAPTSPRIEGKAGCRLVALNVGITRSVLKALAFLGCEVTLLPSCAKAEEVMKSKAKGLLVAGGPGDPHMAAQVVDTIKTLLGRVPILGIGLGHELLALALGCAVRRMKNGHHGVNYSVKRLADGKGEITVQHHSFVVEREVPAGVEVTHINVNDGTVEGIRSRNHAASSVQFHPTNDDWDRPNSVYSEFLESL